MSVTLVCWKCERPIGTVHALDCVMYEKDRHVSRGDCVKQYDGAISPEAPIWPEHPEYFKCCGNLRTIGHMPNCSDAHRYGWKMQTLGELRLEQEGRRASDPTNPKDMIGAQKLPLSLVPDTMDIYAAMAFAEGASKYGAYNWRAAGVRFSIYIEALRRHTDKLWNGEWADPITLVPHLSNMLACVAIIADAHLCGKLVDDRPPQVDLGKLIADNEAVVRHVNELNRDKSPHHWTINDKP